MTKIESIKARMKVKWLMAHTQLQKQLVAKMVGVSRSMVSRNINPDERSLKHRKARKLTEEEMANYLDYCLYLDGLLEELESV